MRGAGGVVAAVLVALLAGCGGGPGEPPAGIAQQCPDGPDCGGTTGGGGLPGGSTTGATTGSTTGSSTGGGTGISNGSSKAAQLASRLGRANRFLVGLGGYNEASVILSQALRPDVYDRYLSDNPGNSWVNYNSPPGAYVDIVAATADQLDAVPMFTLYQFAVAGEANLSMLTNSAQMTTYWSHAVLAFQRIGAYGKPALVNLEPDFWGFTEQRAPGNDPTRIPALVKLRSECAALPDNVAGIARCLLTLARRYAPNALVGFPPSTWGANSNALIVAYMNALGAADADFIVEQAGDRDAGCWEAAQLAACTPRAGAVYYWDESNTTSPNYAEHLATAKAWHDGIGGLPLLWWQIPLGVPSDTRGGSPGAYRDNRVRYILGHADEFTAAGGLGVVFGAGASSQTTIASDGGQFQELVGRYLAAPASLP